MSDTANAEAASENVDAADATTNPSAPAQLPEDHPLVKTLAAQKAEIKALKDRASKLDEIEEAQKSEEQKAADRLQAAEKARDEAIAKAARLELAVAHRLTVEDAALLEGVTDPDALKRLAERLAKEAADEDKGTEQKSRAPRPDRSQDAPRGGGGNSTADLFAAAFEQQLH